MYHWSLPLGELRCLGMLLVWGLLIALVVFAIFALSRGSQARPAGPAAPGATPDHADAHILDTLRRRLAAGEITSEEFDELRRKLNV
jgi:uncharacterized membrane protein